MFASLKRLFNYDNREGEKNNSDIEAERIRLELLTLEAALVEDPADNAKQKILMVKYNQAVKIYATSKAYRKYVDDTFIKIDELRNTIRKNI